MCIEKYVNIRIINGLNSYKFLCTKTHLSYEYYYYTQVGIESGGVTKPKCLKSLRAIFISLFYFLNLTNKFCYVTCAKFSLKRCKNKI